MKSCVSIKNHFLAVSLYQIVFCYLSEVWFHLNCHFSVSQLYSITKVKLDYRGFKYNVSVQDPIQSNNYRKGSWCCFLVRPLAKHFSSFLGALMDHLNFEHIWHATYVTYAMYVGYKHLFYKPNLLTHRIFISMVFLHQAKLRKLKNVAVDPNTITFLSCSFTYNLFCAWPY